MTLYEAYSYLYDNRKKNPILRGRFLSAFNYWRNGTGPNEDAQRRHLLQAGFKFIHYGSEFIHAPDTFENNNVISILIKSDEYNEMTFSSQVVGGLEYSISRFGDHCRIHISGPEADLKKIQKKFGIPKKMK